MAQSDRSLPPLVVSAGDPAGISPDILLAAWAQASAGELTLPKFVMLGDVDALNERAKLLGLDVRCCLNGDDSSFLPVVPINNSFSSKCGHPDPSDAIGVIEAITRGVEMIRVGDASGLVTLPINKKHLYDAGFSFPGHTEYLGELAAEWPDMNKPLRAVMMLAGPDLKAVPITIHIPLNEVKAHLTADLIKDTARIVAHDLRTRFDLETPRLAFAGLNPHAGEEGALGREEIEVIEPALNELRAEGINCIGPLPADTMFHSRARQAYDVALCMYHDQALIPAKALAFDDSVNVTLGLPFIRTSPDHGTAYDIAGTGKADPSSFIAALNMAHQMAMKASVLS